MNRLTLKRSAESSNMAHLRLNASRTLLLAIVAVLLAGDAYASTEGHTPSFSETKYLWLNFVLYVGLLYFALNKVIRSAWAGRRERIERSVLSATAEVQAAEQKLKVVEELVADLKTQQARVREEILDGARQEGLVIYRAAQERSLRIAAQAKELINGEARAAEVSLRSQLVSRAVELAKAKFSGGQFSGRQDEYVSAAVERAKRLVS
jgi:F0F1-type ATP synthase membrane subunit b/b'